MTEDVTITRIPAGFERWAELLALIRSAFAYMDGVIDPPSSAHRLTPQSLAEKAKDEVGLIAVRGGDLLGCVFMAERSESLYVGKLAVAESARGLGLGRRLMQAAETHALTLGKPIIELETRIELVRNQETFRALGFEEARRTAHPGYDRVTSITFRKRLGDT